jgi:hypothetical protein
LEEALKRFAEVEQELTPPGGVPKPETARDDLKKALERFAEVERELTPPHGVPLPKPMLKPERVLSLREEEELQQRRDDAERIRKFRGLYPKGHPVRERFEALLRERMEKKS